MAELMERKPVEIYFDIASIYVIIFIVIKVQITGKACINVKYSVYYNCILYILSPVISIFHHHHHYHYRYHYYYYYYYYYADLISI